MYESLGNGTKIMKEECYCYLFQIYYYMKKWTIRKEKNWISSATLMSKNNEMLKYPLFFLWKLEISSFFGKTINILHCQLQPFLAAMPAIENKP